MLLNIVTFDELLRDAISHGVHSLEVRLDSQLVVSQLNGLYRIRDLTLLQRFLHVRLLQRQFENIKEHKILTCALIWKIPQDS